MSNEYEELDVEAMDLPLERGDRVRRAGGELFNETYVIAHVSEDGKTCQVRGDFEDNEYPVTMFMRA